MTSGAVTDLTAYTGRNGYVDNAKILLDELHAHELTAPANCACAKCRILAWFDGTPCTACSVPPCERRATRRGLCHMHYQRWHRTGFTR